MNQTQIKQYHNENQLTDEETKSIAEEALIEENRQITGINIHLDRMRNDELDLGEIVC